MPVLTQLTRREWLRLASTAFSATAAGWIDAEAANRGPLPASPKKTIPAPAKNGIPAKVVAPAMKTTSPSPGKAPSSPVAVGRCETYDAGEVAKCLTTLFDRIGGLRKLVNDKTVTVKINATGRTEGFMGMPASMTYHTHPAVVKAAVDAMAAVGARRICIVESAPARTALEEYLSESGWTIRDLQVGKTPVRFENTRNRGAGKQYVKMTVPGGGLLFPAFLLNTVYEETDVFVSIAKLKAHTVAGVTVCMKNLFGITPNALYGDDAGRESAVESRSRILHGGWGPPPDGVPRQISALGYRDAVRVPRIVIDLNRARPVHLCIVDGISSIAGGEGPWSWPLRRVQPKVLMAGRNAVCTDAVATALMGYDPVAKSGVEPFAGDNMVALAASAGMGENRLDRIEVIGVSMEKARTDFGEISRPRPWW